MGLVLGNADPAVTQGALEYLTVISVLFCFHGLLMIFRNTLQGLGYSTQAVISGVGELVGRSVGGWLAVHSLGYFGICIANPIAWAFALAYCVIMVMRMLKKRGHARSECVGGGVPAPPWNVVAGKRAIPANPPLIRRFTPPSHMGGGFEKNVHRRKFIIDFSRSLCGTAVFLYPLTNTVSLCYLMAG